MSALSQSTLDHLRHVSVATLCTQLFKRGLRNVYIQGIARLTRPSTGNLVGPAFTMRNIPSREDIDKITAFDNPEHPQRKAIESVPPGHVLVLDCRGETRVASGGQILTTRLKVRGAAGLVSDGPVRDSVEIGKMDFPVYCAGGSAPHCEEARVPLHAQACALAQHRRVGVGRADPAVPRAPAAYPGGPCPRGGGLGVWTQRRRSGRDVALHHG